MKKAFTLAYSLLIRPSKGIHIARGMSTKQSHFCGINTPHQHQAKPQSECNYCYHKHKSLDCNPCRYLEDVDQLRKVDYFQFFCLDKTFDIDLTELNAQFKQYQKFIHPDKFSLAKNVIQDSAHELSSFANNSQENRRILYMKEKGVNAYFTLLNELQRAAYLLKIKYGLDVLTESASLVEHDPEFIERVFETRMEIDECTDDQELVSIQTDLLTQQGDKINQIRILFNNNSSTDAEDIKLFIEEAKYLEKMLDEVSVKEGQLRHKE